jgi:hypothetical protein
MAERKGTLLERGLDEPSALLILRKVLDLELGEEDTQVSPHRVYAKEKFVRDLLVGGRGGGVLERAA